MIETTVPFDQLVDAAEDALATEPSVFQRNGELVQVIKDKGNVGVHHLRPSIARYLLSRVADWIKVTGEGDSLSEKPVHPPLGVAKCLVDKTSWQHILPLRAVSAFPPMSVNGVVKDEEGYDEDTHVYFAGGVECRIPSRPTKTDAVRASDILLDVVCDFPFGTPAHKSAWLAALLTPCARFMHNGNSPIVVVQANSPRVGKTTLVHIISNILTGTDSPFFVHTTNEDEERKRILPYLRKGGCMVLIDNVVGQWGGASINAVTTSRIFEDRIVGQSKILRVVNDTSLFITGNNIALAPDTAERCLHIRLHSDEERPHLRAGFRHGSDLPSYVRQRRAELLSAALTILKAYIVAGMPEQNIPAWGSFEPWSRIVRGAIVWAGLPDPAETREELEVESDVKRHEATEIVEGWDELLNVMRSPDGMTTREALEALKGGVEAPKLRAALEEMSGSSRLPTAHTIGRHFREIRDRNFAGKMLKCEPNDKTGHRWYVEEVGS